MVTEEKNCAPNGNNSGDIICILRMGYPLFSLRKSSFILSDDGSYKPEVQSQSEIRSNYSNQMAMNFGAEDATKAVSGDKKFVDKIWASNASCEKRNYSLDIFFFYL